MTADFPDWQAPQAHANAIGVTGVPLTAFKTIIASNVGGLNIPANSTVALPTPTTSYGIGQVSYEFLFTLFSAAAAAPVIGIELVWSDSVTGLLTWDEQYFVFAGRNLAGAHSISGRGPSKGDRLQVNISNNSATAATAVFVLQQTSRPYSREFWQTVQQAGFANPVFNGLAYAAGNMSAKTLCSQSQLVAAAGNNVFVLPLYTGLVHLYFRSTDGTLANNEWRIVCDSDQNDAGDTNRLLVFAGASGFAPYGSNFQSAFTLANYPLRNAQTKVQMLNHNATTAATHLMHVTAAELVTT